MTSEYKLDIKNTIGTNSGVSIDLGPKNINDAPVYSNNLGAQNDQDFESAGTTSNEDVELDQHARDYAYSDSAYHTSSFEDDQMTFDDTGLEYHQNENGVKVGVSTEPWVSTQDPNLVIPAGNVKKYEDKEHGIVAYLVIDPVTNEATIVYRGSDSVWVDNPDGVTDAEIAANINSESFEASRELTDEIIADNPDYTGDYRVTGHSLGGAYAEANLINPRVVEATGFSSPDIGYIFTKEQRKTAKSKKSTFYGDASDLIFMNGRFKWSSVGKVRFYENSKFEIRRSHNHTADRIKKGKIATSDSLATIMLASITAKLSNKYGDDLGALALVIYYLFIKESATISKKNSADTISLQDGFTVTKANILNTIPILESIKTKNDNLLSGMNEDFENKIVEIAARYDLSSTEVRDMAYQLGLNPEKNIDLDAVDFTSRFINRKTEDLIDIANKTELIYNNLHRTDDMTANNFG